MCLDAVTETYDHPSTLIVDGWKEFGGSTKQPTFQNYTYKATESILKEYRASLGSKLMRRRV
jgi:hypothetical protein